MHGVSDTAESPNDSHDAVQSVAFRSFRQRRHSDWFFRSR
jgi:hypothetical protein